MVCRLNRRPRRRLDRMGTTCCAGFTNHETARIAWWASTSSIRRLFPLVAEALRAGGFSYRAIEICWVASTAVKRPVVPRRRLAMHGCLFRVDSASGVPRARSVIAYAARARAAGVSQPRFAVHCDRGRAIGRSHQRRFGRNLILTHQILLSPRCPDQEEIVAGEADLAVPCVWVPPRRVGAGFGCCPGIPNYPGVRAARLPVRGQQRTETRSPSGLRFSGTSPGRDTS